MCFIRKGLIAESQNLGQLYAVEIKRVVRDWIAGEAKTRGEKMKGTSIMLLKTNVENMSENRLSTMLMKIKDL
jgi:hypothetical protein